MEITTEKQNEANALIKSSIPKETIEKKIDKLAKQYGKQMNVSGFRKGKVPPSIVKKMHGEQLEQDAEAEALREALEQAYKELGIEAADIIGDPAFKKYEKGEEAVEAEVLVCLRPKIDVEGYEKLVPEYEVPEVSDEEVEERLKTLAEQSAPLVSLEEDRPLQEGDTAVFDFTGYLDGEAFEGGSAQDFELQIGSGQFIPGFEEQMVGMKKGESKRITVTFPEDYQAENLKGKEVEFDITLKDIKVKAEPKIDDELAKAVTKKEDATLETLKEQIKEQLQTEKLSKLYNEELKPKLLEALVEAYEFDLPENIVEQEIDNLANQKAQSLSKEELEAIQGNAEKIEELRESVREDAERSVKATFIVDAVARAAGVDVSDQEVSQALYYEALISGQDPEALLKYYQKNNLFPAVKMGMIEDKLFAKLLDLDNAGKK
ncbi:trigger factor [Nitratifractor sp.]